MKIRNESLFEVLADKNSQLILNRTPCDKYSSEIIQIIDDIKNDGPSEEKYISLINEFHRIGLFREAVEVSCEAISTDPFNWGFHLLRGYNNLHIEQIAEAAANLEFASRMNPESFEAQLYGGIAHFLAENYSKSNYFFNQALELSNTFKDKCDVILWYWIFSSKQENGEQMKEILSSIDFSEDASDNSDFSSIDMCKLYKTNELNILTKIKTKEQMDKYKYFIAWYEIITGNRDKGYSLLNDCSENSIFSIQSVAARKDLKKIFIRWTPDEF
ncbi:hypothetical protein HZF24_14135 [Sedimentibacter hydroxybenzoicus DSM 7310]|uniref:Tetratricopeptide repeat-containing protein n=1 Tax=Sedimentibacter hydroxybenzoicus DSM 7310 TaxID=1123245 RepID=A0A974BLH6_SEDHY|nr:hypothetical protein [Sedimentibacter hydroxybenzoicus]NYB75282.1 hypothetical protein [Sedimentibacter hydroxybenzoicus DSM 7310]